MVSRIGSSGWAGAGLWDRLRLRRGLGRGGGGGRLPGGLRGRDAGGDYLGAAVPAETGAGVQSAAAVGAEALSWLVHKSLPGLVEAGALIGRPA